jgi:hypothetical protein
MHGRDRPTVLRNRPLAPPHHHYPVLSQSLVPTQEFSHDFPVARPRNGAKSEVEAWNWWASALHSSPCLSHTVPSHTGSGTAPQDLSTRLLPLFRCRYSRNMPNAILRLSLVCACGVWPPAQSYESLSSMQRFM